MSASSTVPDCRALPRPPGRASRCTRWPAGRARPARVAALLAGLALSALSALPALAAAPAASAATLQLGIGRSSRPGDFDLSLRGRGWQLEYIDEGRQPHGIPNDNRVINLDGVLATPGPWSWFAEAGLSSSRPSRNGSGNGYEPSGPMLGANAGGGVQWRFAPGWWLRLQTLWMRYPQSSEPAMETFGYTSVALVRSW